MLYKQRLIYMLCHQDINRLNDSQQISKFAVHITKTANVISSTETFFFLEKLYHQQI
jgi:hypothetical protein